MAVRKMSQPIQRNVGATSTSQTTPSPTPIAPPSGTVVSWRLPEIWIPRLPQTKCLLYGESGTGKSTFAATYFDAAVVDGRPMLVVAFDPPSKMSPYKDHPLIRDVVPVQDPTFAEWYASIGLQAEDLIGPEGQLLCRIEYYVDPDANNPVAADLVETRFADFYAQASSWYGVVFDSMTFYQLASIRRAQKRMNFSIDKMFAKGEGIDMRQWYGIGKMDIDRLIRHQMLWWPTNGIAIHHTGESADKGEFGDANVRGIATIGKLLTELPPGFDEMYRVKLNMKERVRDAAGRETEDYKRMLQTRHDNLWAATSVTAKAPNPCDPHYLALWQNWLAAKEAKGIQP